MNSCELVTFISSFACTLAKIYSPDELAMLAAIFSQLGDSLDTILAHKDLCQIHNSSDAS